MNHNDWLVEVARYARYYGCIATQRNPCQIHHVVGREGKHEKVHIGHWFILPLWWELHDVHSPHHYNVTHYPKRFVDKYGRQRDLFRKLCDDMTDSGFVVQIPTEIVSAIAATSH